MGNNASAGASGSSGGGLYDGRFFAGRRVEFTLANFRQLHAQLLDFERLPASEIVELLRVLSEFLIYSDQHRGRGADATSPSVAGKESYSAASFFDYFGEKNVLALLVEMGASSPSVAVQIQLLQTLSILVQNIATRTSLYYILSNNYINRLLECPFAVDDHDDVRDWYVTLLKALSLRLNEETVQFFFDSTTARFPLYARALRFGRCQDNMIKVAVKTLTLNVLRVPDERVRSFILHHDGMNYFRDIVDYTNDVALRIQGLLNAWPTDPSEAPASAALIEKLEEAVDEYIDHCYYLQDILDVNLPELCYKVGEWLYTLHVRALLAASVLPDCNPPPQRVSTRLALYLMTRLLGILEHPPLVNAIAFMYVGATCSPCLRRQTSPTGLDGITSCLSFCIVGSLVLMLPTASTTRRLRLAPVRVDKAIVCRAERVGIAMTRRIPVRRQLAARTRSTPFAPTRRRTATRRFVICRHDLGSANGLSKRCNVSSLAPQPRRTVSAHLCCR